MDNQLEIEWYGRCCFAVKVNDVKILFDPYDRFCNVDMGIVDAEILLSSSTWHDHGHIGASPGSFVFTYPGNYEHKGIIITGIEAKEDRGTPNVVFNVQYKNISITNFADLGVDKIDTFFSNLTTKQMDLLRSITVAFIRSGREKITELISAQYIIPEHYFPREFVKKQIPQEIQQDFENQNIEIDKMIEKINYPTEEINDYKYKFDIKDNFRANIVRFLKVHTQVKYDPEPEFKKYW